MIRIKSENPKIREVLGLQSAKFWRELLERAEQEKLRSTDGNGEFGLARFEGVRSESKSERTKYIRKDRRT